MLSFKTLGLLVLACAWIGCRGPQYAMDVPTSFRKFEKREGLQMITADGVMLKAREVRNYPKAELAFWSDALTRHMEARGFAKKSRRDFKTQKGLAGTTIDFIVPYGVEDWVMSETVFVRDDRIVLVEAAGPFDRYAKVEKELEKALKSFDPGT